MAKGIKKIAKSLRAEIVDRVPETGGGAFGQRGSAILSSNCRGGYGQARANVPVGLPIRRGLNRQKFR